MGTLGNQSYWMQRLLLTPEVEDGRLSVEYTVYKPVNDLVQRLVDGFEYGWRKGGSHDVYSMWGSHDFLSKSPIFFLSTGRTGTMLLTHLLSAAKGVKVFHSPVPTFTNQANYLRHTGLRGNTESVTILEQIFMAGREHMLFKTYRYGLRYVETNHPITFLSPAIARLLPEAKFVFLFRHPGEFVRSGVRRGWYSGVHPHDKGRLRPTEDEISDQEWKDFSQIKKIAWLWDATNAYIERTLENIASSRHFQMNFNELSVDLIYELLSFLELCIDELPIRRHLKRKVNVQRTGNFPSYDKWTLEQQNELIGICGDRAARYGYILK